MTPLATLTLGILFILSSIASACTENAYSIELRGRVYKEDVDSVERLLSEHQAAFEAGERSSNDMRCLFTHFERTRPETLAFIDRWRAHYPASPHAKVAKAFSLNTVSWSIRGQEYARNVYPKAMLYFNSMQYDAWRLAWEAFRENERHIPASDAIILLSNANRGHRDAISVVDSVMDRDPNARTLDLMVSTVFANWGGTWKTTRTLCEKHALKVPGAGEKAVLICMLKGARNFEDMREWMTTTIRDEGLTELDHLRLWEMTVEPQSPEEIATVYRHLTDPNFVDYDAALLFDRYAAKTYGYPFVSGEVGMRMLDRTRAALEHDPYNIRLLEKLRFAVDRVTDSDASGQTTTERLYEPTHEEEYEIALKLLVASRYDPKRWKSFLRYLERKRGEAAAAPYRANVIAYANHSPDALQSYLLSLRGHYNAYHYGLDENATPVLRELAQSTNLETDVYCPFLRVTRLHAARCFGMPRQDGCEIKGEKLQAEYKNILDEALSLGICAIERNAPIENLFFDPIPLDEAKF